MRSIAPRVLTQPSPLDLVTKTALASLEAKAKDPVILNIGKLTDIAQYFVIVTGRSDRHVQGITHHILQALETLGIEPSSIEGLETAHWVLLDCDEVIVHIFYEPIRSRYDLEGLWARAKRVNVEGAICQRHESEMANTP